MLFLSFTVVDPCYGIRRHTVCTQLCNRPPDPNPCGCTPGYELQDDGFTCLAINGKYVQETLLTIVMDDEKIWASEMCRYYIQIDL